MDTPKRMKNGQAVQENMEVSGMEEAPANTPTGTPLGMKIIDGKTGTSESVGLPQTDFTDHPGGPAPETSADSL